MSINIVDYFVLLIFRFKFGESYLFHYTDSVEAKYEIILHTFCFSLISPIFLKKKAININFRDLLSYSSTFLKIEIQPKKSE